MRSGNHVSYWDVVSGKKADDASKLPLVKQGYDSLFVEVLKPKQFIDPKNSGMSRYASALPISSKMKTLGEGGTPLVESKKYPGLYIKNEGINPTGSFKDRESVVAMTYVKENNFEEASIVSSGNAALSAALYAKIYGIPLTCYVPKRTSKQKTDIIDTFGAKYHLIGDTYEEAYYHLLNNPPKNALNITSGVLSARSDGSKTIAYEIWEDLQGVPDVVVCPAGNGSLLSAVYHGFSDLKNWGFTDRIPAMISVQISGADPINQAFEQNQWIKDIKDPADSICEAIVASESYCSPRAVYAMRDSGGFGISLTDKQIIKGAKYAVNVEGIFPEISSASVFAAYLENEKEIKQKGDTVVLINSGTSLKDVAQVRDVLVSNSSEKSCFFYKNNA